MSEPLENDRDFHELLRAKIAEDRLRPLPPSKPESLIRKEEFGEPILQFRGPYRFLSNFWMSPTYALNMCFSSVEAAYQAAKRIDDIEYHRQMVKLGPKEAKELGRSVEITTPEWDTLTKFSVMRMLVEQKFTEDFELRCMLLATKSRHLEEGNDWGDKVWGTDINDKLHPLISELMGTVYNGKNMLGKILMETRDALRTDALVPAYIAEVGDGYQG